MAQYPENIAILYNPNPDGTLLHEDHAGLTTKQNLEIIAIQTNLGEGGCAGNKENLKERLETSLNPDGTLKLEIVIIIEDLSSQIPGTDFITTYDFQSTTVEVYVNGIKEKDKTILTDKSFQLNPALESGDDLEVKYLRKY